MNPSPIVSLENKEKVFIDLSQLLNNHEWKTSEITKDTESEKIYFKTFPPAEKVKFITIFSIKTTTNAMIFETMGNLDISKEKITNFPEVVRQKYINTIRKDIAILNLLPIDDFPGIGAQKLLFFSSLQNPQYIFDVLNNFINTLRLIEIRFQELKEEYADIFDT